MPPSGKLKISLRLGIDSSVEELVFELDESELCVSSSQDEKISTNDIQIMSDNASNKIFLIFIAFLQN